MKMKHPEKQTDPEPNSLYTNSHDDIYIYSYALWARFLLNQDDYLITLGRHMGSIFYRMAHCFVHAKLPLVY